MCVFRAAGPEFDVARYLEKSRLKPCGVYRKGEPRNAANPSGRKNRLSGFNVSVSDADWSDLGAQTADALRFLRKHQADLKRLSKFPGVKSLSLDFPINLRIGRNHIAVQSDSFSAALVKAAGSLDLELALTVYPDGPGKWWQRLRSPVGPIKRKKKGRG